MDAHEAAKRGSPHRHQNSNSSVESFASSSSPDKDREREREFERGMKEGRRSINFGRKSLDEKTREVEVGEKIRVFKGRLRALTGGRSADVKPYAGT